MFRLTRIITQSPALRNANLIQATASQRSISLKVVPGTSEKEETYTEKNLRLKREMSPHLTIYKPQLTSMLSITHRMFGMVLAGYFTTLGLGALVSPCDFSYYVTMIEGLKLGDGTLTAAKFVLAYPLSYHTLNGIRHLLWDYGLFLKIKEVYATGYAMLGGSIILSSILALL